MKHGRSPSGGFYFPTFPYRSYAGLTNEDALAMGSWLMSLEPVSYQGARARNALVAEPGRDCRLERIGQSQWAAGRRI